MAWCTPQVEFTKEIFFPGENVTGRAWVSTKKDMSARNVEISFFGKSVTAWRTDGDRKNRPVEDKSFKKGEETYVVLKHVVWTPDDGNNTFPSGDYEWNFSFELPNECPPSFEGKFGFIRYYVSVHIDVPNWIDKKVERAITVSPIIDLNSIPGANEPLVRQIERVSEKCACIPFLGSNGNIVYTIKSPTLGYVAGDLIRVTGSIENRSSKPLSEIEAIFKRIVVYRKDMTNSLIKSHRNMSNTPDTYNSRKESYVIEEITEICEIEPGATKNFRFSFIVPPVVSTIRSSTFINVEYLVTIAADRQFCDSSEIPTLNIIVGNVPILSEGNTSLPPHIFVKSDSAQCWSHLLKPKFRYQIPYYGSDEPTKTDSEDSS
ncbi:hypothetical protein CRE_11666 [Caenorhabditis remanei]|uniref:Uncharacterized protein n=1 Tax=Caenorhabditis remanei TaxID=31234 RepID=E3M404_CAERE|nr:hypothetical protein CRE_11666 [Caenorhabditis remanei]